MHVVRFHRSLKGIGHDSDGISDIQSGARTESRKEAARRLSCADPIGALALEACRVPQTRATQMKYLPCDTRVRTEWSFRVRPDH